MKLGLLQVKFVIYKINITAVGKLFTHKESEFDYNKLKSLRAFNVMYSLMMYNLYISFANSPGLTRIRMCNVGPYSACMGVRKGVRGVLAHNGCMIVHN